MSEEDSAVKEEAVVTQDTTITDSAPVETDSSELADPINWDEDESTPAKAEDKPQTEDKAEETEADADVTPADSEETETEEQPQDGEKPLSPKSENKFQKLVNENKEYRNNLNDPTFLAQKLAELNAQEVQTNTEQELLNQINPETGEFFTVAEAERFAKMQANEVKQTTFAQQRQELQIQQNQNILDNEAIDIIREHPEFLQFMPGTERLDPTTGQVTGTPNPKYNAALANQAANMLEQSLIRDPNVPEIDPLTGQYTGRGMIIGSYLSPKQIYESLATAAKSSVVEGQIQGQKAAEKMMANADSVGSAAPPKVNKDPVLAIWEDDSI